MKKRFSGGKTVKLASFAVVILGLDACSGAPTAKSGATLGYGTPGVSAYGQTTGDNTVQAMVARCSAVPQAGVASELRGLPAACGQLHRTLRNQPGNTVQPGREL